MLREQTGLGSHGKAAGFTFAELAFGLVIFVVGAVVLINHLSVNYSSTRDQQDRVFAFSKAQAILAELHAYVDRGEIAAAIDLDALDDGVVNKPTLSISTEGGTLIVPDHPLSGNWQRGGNWLWSRRITVQHFPGLSNRNMRYVTVRIFRRDPAGNERPLADLSSVINSAGSAFPTTQVFDVYLLAIESIPGWWVYMDAIRPFVESTINDLESRNPGLEARTHWITKSSYGRNKVYRPHINDIVESDQNVSSVYYYPGRMPAGNASTYYYVPGNLNARLDVDGNEAHGYQPVLTNPDYNPYPYALADYYNHAMRYPEERAFHDQRVAAIKAAKAANADSDDLSEEPTLRLFLEDLATNPNKYRHALIINLHGELLPMPPLRNYSDAAKCAQNLPEVRVVTHPEELRTNRTALGALADVVLRVYAYKTRPGANPAVTTMPATMPIALQVMGVDLTNGAADTLWPGVVIQNVPGGVMLGAPPVVGSNAYPAAWQAGKLVSTLPAVANEMRYEVRYVDPGAGQEKYTLFKLYQTPVVAPPVTYPVGGPTRGVPANERGRLYGMEYVPSCCEAALDFTRDLTFSTNTTSPRNTARWKIRIPKAVLTGNRFRDLAGASYNPAGDVTLTVRTRIWDPAVNPDQLNTGTMYPTPIQPENLSETYTWWADSSNDVPATERAQFQGDPRHLPYKDCWNGGEFGNAYNWHWDVLNNGGEDAYPDFPGIDPARMRSRWNGALRQDLPRFMELLRSGVVTAQALWTTLTGFSYYYTGFGGEIGYDSANGYPSSIPTHLRPFGSPAAVGFIDTITGAQRLVRGSGANYWWGMPWLGELYPDNVCTTQWLALDAGGRARGNLDAGTGANQFWREREFDVYNGSAATTAYGTALNPSSIQRTNTLGCTSFFNIGTAATTFHHSFNDGQTGNLVDAGPELSANYNFPLPNSASISRPFNLNLGGGTGSEFAFTPYQSNRYVGSLIKRYYDHQSGLTGSGLVQLRNPLGTQAAYIIVNGLDRTVESGSAFIAKYSLLSMVQSFFECGAPGLGALRIKQPARVSIDAPTEITELNDPATISIQWHIDWKRWDGLKYTTGTSALFTEPENEVDYVLMYSRDNGTTWLYAQDDSPAVIGVRPTNPAYLLADAGLGPESYTWPVPAASFPQGSYLIRIEGYRQNQALHYSQHQVKIFVNR